MTSHTASFVRTPSNCSATVLIGRPFQEKGEQQDSACVYARLSVTPCSPTTSFLQFLYGNGVGSSCTSFPLGSRLPPLTSAITNNESIRSRFGIEKQNSAQASRLLNEALEAGRIRLVNPDVANKLRRYMPYWA
jgi:hypothetical protein